MVRDERGVVFVEYVTLLTVVTLAGAAAVFSLGVPLLRLFRYAELLIVLPIP
jgi:Flp pilus assembly pilin Flp